MKIASDLEVKNALHYVNIYNHSEMSGLDEWIHWLRKCYNMGDEKD